MPCIAQHFSEGKISPSCAATTQVADLKALELLLNVVFAGSLHLIHEGLLLVLHGHRSNPIEALMQVRCDASGVESGSIESAHYRAILRVAREALHFELVLHELLHGVVVTSGTEVLALLPGLGRVVFDGRVPLHTLVTTEFFLLGAVDIRDENRRRVLVLGPQLVIPAS